MLRLGKKGKYRKYYRLVVRDRVLKHYGGNPPQCACCGETRPHFLAIDHIKGGGNQHRKTLGYRPIEYWIEANNFPPGFRVLCHNCNMAIGFYGHCPHEAERELNKLICFLNQSS